MLPRLLHYQHAECDSPGICSACQPTNKLARYHCACASLSIYLHSPVSEHRVVLQNGPENACVSIASEQRCRLNARSPASSTSVSPYAAQLLLLRVLERAEALSNRWSAGVVGGASYEASRVLHRACRGAATQLSCPPSRDPAVLRPTTPCRLGLGSQAGTPLLRSYLRQTARDVQALRCD